MTSILLRLARDVASNALTACVEAVHGACEVYLFDADVVEANRRERARLSLQTAATRYERAARERSMRS